MMKTGTGTANTPILSGLPTRFTLRKIISIASFLGATLLTPAISSACASCGCTLSSDFLGQGLSAKHGFMFDIRYDYLNQNQLRSGTGTISSVDASKVDNGTREVEEYTKNQYLTLGMDYIFNHDWSVNVQLPYIKRKHSTLGTGSDGINPGDEAYVSDTSNLGDVKIVGRYLGFTPQRNLGVTFGLKLPTGSHNETGTSTDPASPGDVADIDPGLQPGTGSTDVIAGLSYFDSLNRDWDYFSQVIYQAAVAHRSGYKPGNGLNVNFGLQFMRYMSVIPQVQLNIRNVQTDSGELADTYATGGTLYYLSPGIIVKLNESTSIHGVVQLPLYQDLKGIQLAPRYIASVGVHFAI
jgi:hypothetical protein